MEDEGRCLLLQVFLQVHLASCYERHRELEGRSMSGTETHVLIDHRANSVNAVKDACAPSPSMPRE